ncbi:MAG: M28 family peptidase [Longimicrobiales bacterium]
MQFHIDDIRELLSRRPAAPAFDPGDALRAIAIPRLTGSEGAATVTAEVRARFEALGYRVAEQDFTFNPWTGRWGITIAGAILFIGGLAAASMLYFGHAVGAIIVLVSVLLLCLGIAFLLQRMLDRLNIGQVKGKNLLVSAEGSRPHYLLMAHRDSKSQPIPLAFRGPAIILSAVAWIVLMILALMSTVELVEHSIVIAAGTLAVISGVILIFSWVDNNSPGALDNATGVATLLGIAERERGASDVAFLVTDAEELGLAGARAIARQLPPVYGVINFDGLDDAGVFQVVEDFGWPRRRGKAPHLAAALLSAGAALDMEVHRRSVPFGIMLDHIPIVEAGTPALTLMRGSLASLRRVHRPIDDLNHLRGAGVSSAVEITTAALYLLRLREQDVKP